MQPRIADAAREKGRSMGVPSLTYASSAEVFTAASRRDGLSLLSAQHECLESGRFLSLPARSETGTYQELRRALKRRVLDVGGGVQYEGRGRDAHAVALGSDRYPDTGKGRVWRLCMNFTRPKDRARTYFHCCVPRPLCCILPLLIRLAERLNV